MIIIVTISNTDTSDSNYLLIRILTSVINNGFIQKRINSIDKNGVLCNDIMM